MCMLGDGIVLRLLKDASQMPMNDLPIVLEQGAFIAPVENEEDRVWEVVDC